jgi:hypothetical protein
VSGDDPVWSSIDSWAEWSGLVGTALAAGLVLGVAFVLVTLIYGRR